MESIVVRQARKKRRSHPLSRTGNRYRNAKEVANAFKRVEVSVIRRADLDTHYRAIIGRGGLTGNIEHKNSLRFVIDWECRILLSSHSPDTSMGRTPDRESRSVANVVERRPAVYGAQPIGLAMRRERKPLQQPIASFPISWLDTVVALCYHYSMSQPVKLSDSLVLDARITAETAERSIAGQIEFWARIGKAVEPFLSGERVIALRKASEHSLSELLRTVNLPEGRNRLRDYLESLPFPHFEPALDHPGFLVRIDEDGTRTVGRFVNREFVPLQVRRSREGAAGKLTKARPQKSARKKNQRRP
jgi:ParD-like antitoxin of type II bacterial toxin-antitoxin system